MILIKFLAKIEKKLINIRDFFWNYPNRIFFDNDSVFSSFRLLYLKARPLSHSLTIIIVFISLLSLSISNISAVLRIDSKTLMEGVIAGENENGELQTVDFLNPLIVTNIQIKRDIAQLVYEPLIRVNQDDKIEKVLAENIADAGNGKTYRIKLKENVKWHDGEDFNADDVVATFNLLKTLESGNQTSSVYSKAAAKLEIKKVDDYLLEFSLVDQNSLIPNFFEVISFKILPEHLIKDLNSTNILYAEPKLNTNPVGTGPFKVGALNLEKIGLEKNRDYHGELPKIQKIIFKLFRTHKQAAKDIETGQIHTLIVGNTDDIQQLSTIDNLRINRSNVIYNQYWALYFNLNESGNELLKNSKIRRAIESGINKTLITESLVQAAVEAKGPIPQTSFAYADVDRVTYSKEEAIKLLEEEGWVLKEGNKYRMKDDQALEFDLVYVKNSDREKVVTVIKSDLEEIGVKINSIGKTISEVNNDHLLPAFFDILLYGVSTFIDADRYELFHSSQIGYPNLNISGYKSSEETTKIIEGKTQRVPKVDYALERGRSFIKEEDRKDEYETFQRIILSEVPVIFLYHPVYTYITNKRLKGINLVGMTSLEDRFNGIADWYIEVD